MLLATATKKLSYQKVLFTPLDYMSYEQIVRILPGEVGLRKLESSETKKDVNLIFS
jgi:hypothetical protein